MNGEAHALEGTSSRNTHLQMILIHFISVRYYNANVAYAWCTQ